MNSACQAPRPTRHRISPPRTGPPGPGCAGSGRAGSSGADGRRRRWWRWRASPAVVAVGVPTVVAVVAQYTVTPYAESASVTGWWMAEPAVPEQPELPEWMPRATDPAKCAPPLSPPAEQAVVRTML